MSLVMAYSTFRPGAVPRACPRCGAMQDDPLVSIRHEHARFAGHAPAWTVCPECRQQYALGVATGDDCAELAP